MKLYSWNVNGIRAVLSKGSLQQLVAEHDPDVLCLQEVKAKEDQVDLDLPHAYFTYWNAADKAGYSGTAILSKTKPISVEYGFRDGIAETHGLSGDSYGDPNKEGRVTSAEFETFWVVTVYTPNAKGDLSRLDLRHTQWDPAFLEHVQALEQTKPVLFCGDLNVAHSEIDLANPKANIGKRGFTNEERDGFDQFERAGFVDSYRQANPDKKDAYTWWTHWANARARNVGWRIDYWLASRALAGRVSNPQIHPAVMGSDHCPVSIEVET